MKLLKVGSMVLATIAPTAHERWEAFAEGRALHFENAGGLRALTRGVKWAFAHTKPPKWLQTVIASLQMNSISTKKRPSRQALKDKRPSEFNTLNYRKNNF